MALNATVGETPIFDELREALGGLDLEELIGHGESFEDQPGN
jgi:hypothetical protein